MPDWPQGEIYDTLDKFRRRLLRGERQAASALVRAYGGMWQRLNREILDLVAEYKRSGGQETGGNWFTRWERANALRRQVEGELQRFAGLLGRTIEEQGRLAAAQGADDGLELIGDALGPAPAGAVLGFNRLPVQAINNLVGFASGGPLRDLLEALPGEGGQIVYDGLLNGLTMGWGARETARAIRRGLGGQLGRALTIARTETLRAYREATHQTYQANQDIVKGWIWRCARNVRTCASCWALDGSEHTLEERLDDHPNGRCFSVCKTKTWAELGFEGIPERQSKAGTGVDAFARLSESDKLAVLGPAKYAALRDGAIKLTDLVGRRFDPRWGSMRVERSLAEVLGRERAVYYTGRGRGVMGSTWYSTRISKALTTVQEAREAGIKPWGWGDSEIKLREMTARRKVRIAEIERTIGLWKSPEPSFRTELVGRGKNIRQLSRDLRRLYGQDAVAVLIPQKGGKGGILRWEFGRNLSDGEQNRIIRELDKINKLLAEDILGYEIGMTSRGKDLEFWFSDAESETNGRLLIELALEQAKLAAKLQKPIYGFEFYLAT